VPDVPSPAPCRPWFRQVNGRLTRCVRGLAYDPVALAPLLIVHRTGNAVYGVNSYRGFESHTSRSDTSRSANRRVKGRYLRASRDRRAVDIARRVASSEAIQARDPGCQARA